jgi:hypothetical protein
MLQLGSESCYAYSMKIPTSISYTITNLDLIIDITSKLTFSTKAFDVFSNLQTSPLSLVH